jgi:hypothetical protein
MTKNMVKYYLYSVETVEGFKEVVFSSIPFEDIPTKGNYLIVTLKPFKVHLCTNLENGTVVYLNTFNSFLDFDHWALHND